MKLELGEEICDFSTVIAKSLMAGFILSKGDFFKSKGPPPESFQNTGIERHFFVAFSTVAPTG